MRGKKGTAHPKQPRKRKAPRERQADPAVFYPRPMSEVPLRDLLTAISRQRAEGEEVDAAALADELAVELPELLRELAENRELRTQLRQARAALDELRATRIALATPAAAARIAALTEKATPADSVSLGAAQAVLQQAEKIRQGDLKVAPPEERPTWPAGPGEFKPVLVEGGKGKEAGA